MKNYKIHIGVHKTATTHLQDHLAVIKDSLLASAIKFVPRAQMRSARIASLLKEKPTLGTIRNLIERAHWHIGLGIMFCKQDTIIVSEENIIGGVDGLLSNPIYPHLETRLLKLSRILGSEQFSLYLSIRNYAEILPSAYSEYLRHTNKLDGFEKIHAQFLSTPPNWVTFIERIKNTLPKVQLKVWTFESYIKDSPRVISELSGFRIENLKTMPETKETARLSASSIQQIEAIDRSLPRWKKKSMKKKIIASNNFRDKFDPLSENEKKYLLSLYEKDLTTIRERFPLMLIE